MQGLLCNPTRPLAKGDDLIKVTAGFSPETGSLGHILERLCIVTHLAN